MTTKQQTLRAFLAGADCTDQESQQIIRDELRLCLAKLHWLRKGLSGLYSNIETLRHIAKENTKL